MLRTPYGLHIFESCLTCPPREDRLFCNLPPDALSTLSSITKPGTYPSGAVLFVEGQDARGVFILCSGRAKLSTSSPAGKTLILRISEAGEVLGLPATVSGKPYQTTAEILEPGQVSFIPRDSFLRFMREHNEVACRVAEELSRACDTFLAGAIALGLNVSASEKLARLLLDLSAKHQDGKAEARIKMTLTYEEMGQIIGVSRETVTRLLASFRRKHLVQVRGSTLVVRRAALENLFKEV